MHCRSDVRGVNLVGCVPLGTSENVFRVAASNLGGSVRRIQDGETGERANWIRWQDRRLAETPALEPSQIQTTT